MIFSGLLALIVAVLVPVGQAAMPADAALQEFVREALADRFAKRDIPDFGLLPDKQSVLVLSEMSNGRLTLGPEALPNVPDVSFSLIAREAAKERANSTKQKVSYITVDRPSIAGTNATVWLGVDFEAPADPKIVKLCCCSGEAHFEKRDGQWRFVKWGVMVCS